MMIKQIYIKLIFKLIVIFNLATINAASINNEIITWTQNSFKFFENVGQYKYSDGRKAEDILFVANTPTGTVYVRNNGLNIINF